MYRWPTQACHMIHIRQHLWTSPTSSQSWHTLPAGVHDNINNFSIKLSNQIIITHLFCILCLFAFQDGSFLRIILSQCCTETASVSSAPHPPSTCVGIPIWQHSLTKSLWIPVTSLQASTSSNWMLKDFSSSFTCVVSNSQESLPVVSVLSHHRCSFDVLTAPLQDIVIPPACRSSWLSGCH